MHNYEHSAPSMRLLAFINRRHQSNGALRQDYTEPGLSMTHVAPTPTVCSKQHTTQNTLCLGMWPSTSSSTGGWLPHLNVPLEGFALDDLASTGWVHADDAAIAQVEYVAGICQLVVMLDGDDAEALTLHERTELNTLPAGAHMCGCTPAKCARTSEQCVVEEQEGAGATKQHKTDIFTKGYDDSQHSVLREASFLPHIIAMRDLQLHMTAL